MLKSRILTALIIGPVLIAAILFVPADYFAPFLLLFFSASAWEWSRLAGVESANTRLLLTFLFTAVLGASFYLPWTPDVRLLYVGIGIWILAALWLMNRQFMSERSTSSITFKLIVGFIILMVAAHAMQSLAGMPDGRYRLLLLFVLIWAADVGAYAAGRLFGKHKLAINISPGKTWEGLIGGQILVICFVIAATRLPWFSEFLLLPLMMLAILSTLVSVIGDLFISLLKRQRGLKDAGSLFPGHGGMLDRFDSLVAALPFFTIGIMLMTETLRGPI